MIKRWVKAIRASQAGINLKQSKVMGVNLLTIPGTIRSKEDYDDAWWVAISRNSTCIFDIGANVGYTGLLAALAGNPEKMLFVDPNPRALAKAAYNMVVNGFGEWSRFYTAFVGESPGEKVKFYTVGSGAAGSMFADHAQSAGMLNQFQWVETTTIDALCEIFQLTPDLVKIDVEGAESLALRGATNLAGRETTRFFVEMHSSNSLAMLENARRVLEWCNKVGYSAWYCKERVRLASPEPIAHRGKCHLLMQPIAWDYPASLKSIPQGARLPETMVSA